MHQHYTHAECVLDNPQQWFRDQPRTLIFLDVDGVLNSNKWFTSYQYRKTVDACHTVGLAWTGPQGTRAKSHVDPRSVAVLNTIVEHTNAYIVVSSTWRLGYSTADMAELLAAAGFKFPDRIIGLTPVLWGWESKLYSHKHVTRGLEIEAWLYLYTGAWPSFAVNRILIIDDDSDFSRLVHFHLKTSPRTGGLNANHVSKALSMWQRQRPGRRVDQDIRGLLVSPNRYWSPDALRELLTWEAFAIKPDAWTTNLTNRTNDAD